MPFNWKLRQRRQISVNKQKEEHSPLVFSRKSVLLSILCSIFNDNLINRRDYSNPRMKMPTMIIAITVYCAFVSFSFRNMRAKMTDIML
jgi:hypothetical protein